VSSSIPTVILITKPNFVLGQQATFSHEFEAHNDLRLLQSHRQLACVAKTASTDICQIPGLLRVIFCPIEARSTKIDWQLNVPVTKSSDWLPQRAGHTSTLVVPHLFLLDLMQRRQQRIGQVYPKDTVPIRAKKLSRTRPHRPENPG
jgi:hypothetical protein